MKTYLLPNPVWLKPTAAIRALDDKSILIVDGEHRTPAHIRVSDADPQSQHAGLCHVTVWQASIEGMTMKWADIRSGSPPTSQSHQWEMDLTDDALSLLRSNEEDPTHGELRLAVPQEA
jgi:hypothetical protein